MKNSAPVLVAIAATALAAAASCAKRDAATPPAAPAPAAQPDDATLPDRLTLAERLTREAASRPDGGLRAEEVAAALQRAGIDVRPLKQVLARTVGARFCMSAQSRAGLGVAVCEFADDAEAARGVDYSRRTFDRLIPNRHLVRNHGTVLTLTRPRDTPELDDQAARAAQTFASL